MSANVLIVIAWLIATGNQLNQLIVGRLLLCVIHAVLDLATGRVDFSIFYFFDIPVLD